MLYLSTYFYFRGEKLNNKLTNEEFLKRLYNIRGDEYKLIGKYEHCQKRITLLHNKCGKTTEILPSNATSKRLPIPCKYCNPYSKMDTDIFKYKLSIENPEFEVIGEYIGANKPIRVKHNICGKILDIQYASNILKGLIHCPYCHKGAEINTDTFKYKVEKMYKDEYTVLDEYVNSRTRIKIKHNYCNFEYKVMPNEFLRRREQCPICTKNSKKKNDNSVRKELKEKYGNKFILLDHFKTVNDFYDFKCTSCNRVVNLQMGHVLTDVIRCPYCGDGTSYPEKFIRSVLEQLNIKYISEYSSRNCNWCEKYRYDFYLPDYNWIIEVHGLQHYEGGWDLKTVQATDKIKYELAINNGISKYIIIDARKSGTEFIKQSIINSEMSVFDLRLINWNICNSAANKSYYKDIVELWNKGYEVNEIKEIIELSLATIHRKLSDAREAGILTRQYGKGFSTARSKTTTLRNSKKVQCIETGEIFNSAKEADIYYCPNNKYHENVAHCARQQQNTAYGLHWKYIQ